jgi:hypothetical protein
MSLLFQTFMTFEDALQRYKRSFPASIQNASDDDEAEGRFAPPRDVQSKDPHAGACRCRLSFLSDPDHQGRTHPYRREQQPVAKSSASESSQESLDQCPRIIGHLCQRSRHHTRYPRPDRLPKPL